MIAPGYAPESAPHSVWKGKDGLRAGWGLLLFLGFVLSLLNLMSMSRAVYQVLHAPGGMTPLKTTGGDGFVFLALAAAAWAMSRIERRPFARYGLALRPCVTDLLAGLFWGVLLLSSLIGVLWGTHHLRFGPAALHGGTALMFGLEWAAAFLLVGLAEEFSTRGYVQYTAARGIAGMLRAMNPRMRHTHALSFWITAGFFSVGLFMVGHLGNPGESVPGLLAVGAAGAVFAFSLFRTGSLWWAVGFHAAWDWSQSFLFGTPDSGLLAQGHLLSTAAVGRPLLSGGSAGPEGSVLVLPTLALAALVIHLTLPQRAYPLTQDQQPPTDESSEEPLYDKERAG